MAVLLSTSQQVIASKDSITPRTKRSKSSLALISMPQEKLVLLETLTASMFIISIPKDHNGMKFAVKKLRTITQSQLPLGNMMDPRLVLDHFVVQLMSLMYVSKRADIRENLNLPTCHFHK